MHLHDGGINVDPLDPGASDLFRLTVAPTTDPPPPLR